MMALLVIGGMLLLPMLLIAINAIVTAPKGYENEEGFNYVEPKH